MWGDGDVNNLCIIGVPEGVAKQKGTESLFKEIIAENFPNLQRDLDTQVNEVNGWSEIFSTNDHLQDIL